MKIMIKNARLAFPDLFVASAMDEDSKPAFGATFLLDPVEQKDQIAALNAAIEKVAKEKWASKAEPVLSNLRKRGCVCLREGDDKVNASGEAYAGFEGMMCISARHATKPTIIDRDRTPLDSTDGRPYAGCYVNASIEIWPQDNKWGKRVNAQLRGVQFVKDGDAFGGGSPAGADEFEELEEDFGDDDMI